MRDLRPMSIPEMIDATFRLYRDHFAAFLLIGLVVYVPHAILTAFVYPAPEPVFLPGPGGEPISNLGGYLKGLIGSFVFDLVFFPPCIAAMMHCVSAAYFGESLSATECYRRALPRLVPLMLTQLLAEEIIFAGFFLCFVPMVIFALWFYVRAPVVMLEGTSGFAALQRSRQLMQGNLGKAFLLGLLIGLMTVVLAIILIVLILFVPAPYWLKAFARTIFMFVIMPLQTVPIVLFYYDLRIRKEGFDLHILASALEQPAMS